MNLRKSVTAVVASLGIMAGGVATAGSAQAIDQGKCLGSYLVGAQYNMCKLSSSLANLYSYSGVGVVNLGYAYCTDVNQGRDGRANLLRKTGSTTKTNAIIAGSRYFCR